ncbi:hypothetical protein FPV67DRAFT_1401306, partial [Lyophyllum atratum]
SISAHYQGPASLPSDYALLSRYAGNRPEPGEQDRIEEADQEGYTRATSINGSPTISPRPRPMNPTMSHPNHFTDIPMPGPAASENTPLLNPPVPRIDESAREQTSDNDKPLHIFWDELRILTRYALPVFG